MAVATYLVDKSALGRMHVESVADVLAPLIDRGLAGACGITAFEVLYSAQSAADYLRLDAQMDALFEWLPTEDRDYGPLALSVDDSRTPVDTEPSA